MKCMKIIPNKGNQTQAINDQGKDFVRMTPSAMWNNFGDHLKDLYAYKLLHSMETQHKNVWILIRSVVAEWSSTPDSRSHL